MLAVLAGGGTVPQFGAPAAVEAASAAFNAVAGSVPAKDSRRPADAAVAEAPFTAGADNPALAAVLLRAARTAPLVEETGGAGSRASERGHPSGGKLWSASGGLLRALDLTASTRGQAPASPARHASCRAHGIRAGPLT